MSNVIERVLVEKKQGYDIWRTLSVLEFDVGVISSGHDQDASEVIAAKLAEASGSVVETLEARTPCGSYIGSPKLAKMLIGRGIHPMLVSPDANVCSIGFSAHEQKWYGWSHRAIYGFGVGSVVKEGDCTASSGWTEEYLQAHPEKDLSLPVGFEAKTLSDARRMAIAFADSVG